MAVSKDKKQEILKSLKDKIAKQKAMVIVGIEKIKVKDLTNLRNRSKDQDCEVKVAKKTLMRIALKDKGLEFDAKSLPGEIALIFGYEDELAPAKIAKNFSKENENLRILGGYLENSFRSSEEVIALANIPSKNELLARLVGSLSAPSRNFVCVLQGNIKGLVYALNAIKNTK